MSYCPDYMKTLIDQFDEAAQQVAFIGAQPHEERDSIQYKYDLTKANLTKAIGSLSTGGKPKSVILIEDDDKLYAEETNALPEVEQEPLLKDTSNMIAHMKLSGYEITIGASREKNPAEDSVIIWTEDSIEDVHISVTETRLLIAALQAAIQEIEEI